MDTIEIKNINGFVPCVVEGNTAQPVDYDRFCARMQSMGYELKSTGKTPGGIVTSQVWVRAGK